ncbi:MAG: ATP-dependent RNA helicase HrpA [Gammaproteobacteria bacterium]|nr:ATP-dependent RNA helicase HrpA [Gammaproteobacteria bacterium]
MTDLSSEQLQTECKNQLQLCLLTDHFRLHRKFNKIIHKLTNDKARRAQLEPLLLEIQTSITKTEARCFDISNINYPTELPVSHKKEEIKNLFMENQVIIVCGETGSGKTTQLPKICLESGYGKRGIIGHTQPRRLAARSVANRIAEELGTELGQTIGYKVRFNDQVSSGSQVKLMTDGILLSEINHDPYLNQYDCLIIDEAHERSLNIDFILGYLKLLLPKRPDLKLVITSATIDPQRFSKHFNDAPVIEVSGRTYPVEILYRPLIQEGQDRSIDLQQGIANAIEELSSHGRGDILVFLSGERDIKDTANFLKKQNYDHTEILTLIARLSITEQTRIFKTSARRRIILSTNIAETSLTVPGIKYVIDSGLARISRYSWKNKIQRLPIEPVSQASANQRKGRCGRTSNGTCIRLYSEDDFNQRDEFTQPEIQRTNLASVILQMENNHLGHIENFPFLEAPDNRLIKDGYRLLFELGAFNTKNKLTKTGRTLYKLPIEPRFARILIEANHESSLTEALIIISALSIQDPRERPLDKRQQAHEKHRQFEDKHSDFITLLNIWTAFHDQKSQLTNNKLRTWCSENYLSWPRIREWLDTHKQIKQILNKLGFSFNQTPANYDQIHRALLSGLLGHVGLKTDESEYQTTRNRKFHIFPGSSLAKSRPKYVMSAEILETSRVYAHFVAKIDLDWVLRKASHLLKHSYQNPHWSKKSSTVKAYRQSSLYGLIIQQAKIVNYGDINPVESREIFIQSALIEGHLNTSAFFYKHNHELVDSIKTLEAKQRKSNILTDDADLFQFYATHLPNGIYSGALLDKWLQTNDGRQLLFDQGLVTGNGINNICAENYPDHILINNVNFPLEYSLNPAGHNDGITVITPAAAIMTLDPDLCEWLIPGLLHEKITALIRSLPKSLRRYFVPAPDFATACIKSLTPVSSPLISTVSNQLTKMTGITIPYDAWRPELLNDYLFLNFRVIDETGNILKESRNLLALQETYKDHHQNNIHKNIDQGLDHVDPEILNDFPGCYESNSSGIKLTVYPALTKEKNKVALRIYYSKIDAANAHYAGIRQLYINNIALSLSKFKRQFVNLDKICVIFRKVDSCSNITIDIYHLIIDELFTSKTVSSTGDFNRNITHGLSHIETSCKNWSDLLTKIGTEYNEVMKKLNSMPLQLLDSSNDIREQLSYLVFPGFISETPDSWLIHYPRFLKAINYRLQKIQSAPLDDRKKRLEFSDLWSQYRQRADDLKVKGRNSSQLNYYRWLLEEFRVSLYAQHLKTSLPISTRRLKEHWDSINDI